MTPLRQRMLEDMQLRNFSPHTQTAYLSSVAHFAQHFGTAPDQLGPAHLRAYLLHRLAAQLSRSSLVVTVSALRFLYRVTLKQPWQVDDVGRSVSNRWFPWRPIRPTQRSLTSWSASSTIGVSRSNGWHRWQVMTHNRPPGGVHRPCFSFPASTV